jgi:immune inhibitor A
MRLSVFKGKEENYLSVYFKIIKLQNRKRTRVEVRCQTPLNPNKTIQFVPYNRFFLDDVKVIGPANKTENGIRLLDAKTDTHQCSKIYNLNGQFAGTKLDALPKGIYMSNGRKILKF